MKKRYFIVLFAGVFAFAIFWMLLFKISHQQSLEKKLQEPEKASCYYIMDLDGYVTVYEGDKTTVFEYSTIPVNTLPYQVQLQIKEGMKAENLEQVYGFLENYSS